MASVKRLGDYIQQVDVRNKDLAVSELLGITTQKVFFPSIANLHGTDMSKYKIIHKGQFSYVPDTSRRGDKISIALLNNTDEAIVSQAYTVFEIEDKSKLLPKYLMMWFMRPEFDRYARYHSIGSAREVFSWEEMCDVMLPVPSLEEQNRIVSEYEAVENRISVNNRIIKQLEDTALAIYRHMFVENIDADNLPEGWKNGKISDLGTIVSGATPSTNHPEYWTKDGIHWLSPADLSKYKKKFISHGDKDITELGYKSASTRLLPIGTVLFSSRAPIGLLAISTGEVCTNQGFKSIVPNRNIGNGYIYYTLKCMKEMIATQNTGSTFAEVSGKTLGLYDVVIPPSDLLSDFQRFCNIIFNHQYILEKENDSLKELLNLMLMQLNA